MTGRFSARKDQLSMPSIAPRSSWRVALLGFLGLILGAGCGSPMEGALDVDAAQERAIAEGRLKSPTEAPPANETKQQRAARVQKEARDRVRPKP